MATDLHGEVRQSDGGGQHPRTRGTAFGCLRPDAGVIERRIVFIGRDRGPSRRPRRRLVFGPPRLPRRPAFAAFARPNRAPQAAAFKRNPKHSPV